MVLVWKGNLNNLSDFEKNLDEKSKEFYSKYKDSIIDFFNRLDKDGVLNTKFKQQDVDRFVKISEMSDAAFLLNKNVKHFFIKLDAGEKDDLLKKMIKYGIEADKNSVTYQAISILCNAYQTYTEDIKKYLILSVNFDKLGLTDADKKPMGWLISCLEGKGYLTDFLQYIKDNNFIRNAIAHYSFYLSDNGKLIFCDGLLGDEEEKSISDFIHMTVDLNTLSNSFVLIFLTKFIRIEK